MQYSDIFLEYFSNTQHAGILSGDAVFSAELGDPAVSDYFSLYVRVTTCIDEARFRCSTTPALIAGGEYACRWLEGKTKNEWSAFTANQILAALGMGTKQIHIATLITRVVQSVLHSSRIF